MTLVDPSSDFTVSRRIYSDPSIHQRELERVFRPSWMVVGHESELREPGDYVTRYLGTDPVIVTRDAERKLHVLHNSCRHRGVPLCRADVGNARNFRCSYHGWTYSNTGDLRGVTYQNEVYDESFDKSNLGLYRAPHVDTVHGLIFATWNPDAPPLAEALGPMDYYLKAIFGKFDNGYTVMGPPVRTRMAFNWKAETENVGGDGYHTLITHGTALGFGLFPTADSLSHLGEVTGPTFKGRTVDCLNGSSIRIQHLPLRLDQPKFYGYPEEMWPEIENNLSEGQVDMQSRLSVTHGNVFPSTSFLENFKTDASGPGSMCRYVRLTVKIPLAHNCTETFWWHLVPEDAPEQWKIDSQKAYNATNGPAGMFEVDDGENFIGISESNRGNVGPDGTYVVIAGRHRPLDNETEWPGAVLDADRSEHTARGFLTRYHEQMEPDAKAPVIDNAPDQEAPR